MVHTKALALLALLTVTVSQLRCSSTSNAGENNGTPGGAEGAAGRTDAGHAGHGLGPEGGPGDAATDATTGHDVVQDSFDPLDVSFGYDAPSNDSQLSTDSACANVNVKATRVTRPIDIIFIVDNSSSMAQEAKAIQTSINVSFANIIQSAGVDYRVIMLARHGTGTNICVGTPLNSKNCPTTIPGTKAPSINPPIFYHYDNGQVGSLNSLCLMQEWFAKADDFNLAPNGWSQWLRSEAFKVFVEVTDDDVNCTPYNDKSKVAEGNAVAKAFDEDLLAMSPEQFGTVHKRNYLWHSLVGLKAKNAAGDPWLPTDGITTSECSTSSGPGTGYQGLSILTGGLRFPVCEGKGFGKVFEVIAQGVIEDAAVPCEFEIPPVEHGVIDRTQVLLEYTPGDGGPVQQLSLVANEAACGGGQGFYLNDATTKVTLCPASCQIIQPDKAARIQLLLGCYGS